MGWTRVRAWVAVWVAWCAFERVHFYWEIRPIGISPVKYLYIGLGALGIFLIAFFISRKIGYEKNVRFLRELQSISKPGVKRSEIDDFVKLKGFKTVPLRSNVSFLLVQTGFGNETFVVIVYDNDNGVESINISNFDPQYTYHSMTFNPGGG